MHKVYKKLRNDLCCIIFTFAPYFLLIFYMQYFAEQCMLMYLIHDITIVFQYKILINANVLKNVRHFKHKEFAYCLRRAFCLYSPIKECVVYKLCDNFLYKKDVICESGWLHI